MCLSILPHLHLSIGASLPPGTHTIPLSQLQGPVGPGSTASLHTPATQPGTLLRLPATVSLAGQNTATPQRERGVGGMSIYTEIDFVTIV